MDCHGIVNNAQHTRDEDELEGNENGEVDDGPTFIQAHVQLAQTPRTFFFQLNLLHHLKIS